ncbi:MAG: bestrophin family protein [Planctomycetaceae bacterium]|nr:bestrophin family protein [Planctomycetaceae bacterium]
MKGRELVTHVAQSRTLSQVSLYSAAAAAYAVIPAWLMTEEHLGALVQVPPDLHAALTLVLGWLLVFRTNTSYARWWEARTLWGALVNTCRNMAIKVADLVRAGDEELLKFRTEIVAFPLSLRDHLRDGSTLQNLPGFQDCPDQPSHVPSYLITRMYEEIGSWKSHGFIDGDELRVLDEEARRFLDICGGCERIRNTRVVGSYRLFARQCVWLYLLTLPWGIVDSFGWWTILLTGLLSYFMLGLETVAEHVEEPFGDDEDDLDLDGLCRTIEISTTEIFDRRLARNADAVKTH